MVESISRRAASLLSFVVAKVGVVLFLGLFCLVGMGAGTYLSFLPIIEPGASVERGEVVVSPNGREVVVAHAGQ